MIRRVWAELRWAFRHRLRGEVWLEQTDEDDEVWVSDELNRWEWRVK